jgi:hypothetical protein
MLAGSAELLDVGDPEPPQAPSASATAQLSAAWTPRLLQVIGLRFISARVLDFRSLVIGSAGPQLNRRSGEIARAVAWHLVGQNAIQVLTSGG